MLISDWVTDHFSVGNRREQPAHSLSHTLAQLVTDLPGAAGRSTSRVALPVVRFRFCATLLHHRDWRCDVRFVELRQEVAVVVFGISTDGRWDGPWRGSIRLRHTDGLMSCAHAACRVPRNCFGLGEPPLGSGRSWISRLRPALRTEMAFTRNTGAALARSGRRVVRRKSRRSHLMVCSFGYART